MSHPRVDKAGSDAEKFQKECRRLQDALSRAIRYYVVWRELYRLYTTAVFQDRYKTPIDLYSDFLGRSVGFALKEMWAIHLYKAYANANRVDTICIRSLVRKAESNPRIFSPKLEKEVIEETRKKLEAITKALNRRSEQVKRLKKVRDKFLAHIDPKSLVSISMTLVEVEDLLRTAQWALDILTASTTPCRTSVLDAPRQTRRVLELLARADHKSVLGVE